MTRKYTKVASLAEDILCMKQKGMTYREIGENFGLSREQVKNLFHRQRRKQRLLEHEYIIRLKGRPRKNEADESIRKDKELARLRMQVELLQNFLCEVGRR